MCQRGFELISSSQKYLNYFLYGFMRGRKQIRVKVGKTNKQKSYKNFVMTAIASACKHEEKAKDQWWH